MTLNREKIAQAVADAQNVTLVGARQRKIEDAVIEAVLAKGFVYEEVGIRNPASGEVGRVDDETYAMTLGVVYKEHVYRRKVLRVEGEWE